MEAIGAHPGVCQRTRVQNQPRPPELLQSARREDREETRQVDDRLGRGARARARIRYCHSILARAAVARIERSEEHTSELQSHLNLVCRLLLEKKKRRLYIQKEISAPTCHAA